MAIDNFKFAYNETVYYPVIREVVKLTSCKLYLELGVAEGLNLNKIAEVCNNCIGVDVQDSRKFTNFEFHLKSTDQFFKEFDKQADIIFIDASHDFEQVKIDFANSLNCLSKHGIIFLHDTDPSRKEFLHPQACNNAYKMHDWVKENYPELCIITLPITIAGLSMVNRDKDRRVLSYI